MYNHLKFEYIKNKFKEDNNNLVNISLPIDIDEIIIHIPDLSNFVNLIKLNVSNCSLIQLPKLPENLIEINCSRNNLRNLPIFNKNLQKLDCSYNYLKIIPTFNENLI